MAGGLQCLAACGGSTAGRRAGRDAVNPGAGASSFVGCLGLQNHAIAEYTSIGRYLHGFQNRSKVAGILARYQPFQPEGR